MRIHGAVDAFLSVNWATVETRHRHGPDSFFAPRGTIICGRLQEILGMPLIMTVIVAASAVLFILWTGWQFHSSKRWIPGVLAIGVLVLYLVLLHFAFGFPSLPAEFAKGGTETDVVPLVLALFVFMLLGMGAEYLYHYLDSKPGETKFDWRSFVKPFLVSPLVFVPLAASLQNAKVDLSRFDIPLLMLFLVAFENGFLWRGYFTRKLAQP
jgi:hypothetical protein